MAHPDEVRERSDSFFDRFLMTVCQFNYLLYMALTLESMLLLLAILSFLFSDPPPQTQTVLLLDFALLGVAVAVTLGGLYVCSRR